MGAYADALAIFVEIKDDPGAIASYQSRYAELRAQLFPGSGGAANGGLRITSATVNGQSFSGTVSVTARHEWNMLKQLVRMIAADAAISASSTYLQPGDGDT